MSALAKPREEESVQRKVGALANSSKYHAPPAGKRSSGQNRKQGVGGRRPRRIATTLWRIFIGVVLLLSLVVVYLQMPHFYHFVEKSLRQFLLWVQKDVGPWGPLILALAYIPCTVLAIPASILTLGGGYLFGLTVGFASDSIGSTLGATAAFLVGRTVGRSYVTSKLKDYPQFRAIAIAVRKSGFKIVLLLRLVPLLPFNVMNYLLSVTPISTTNYIFASWIGMMPVTLTFVYVGTTIKDIADISHSGRHFTRARLIMVSVGLLITIVVGILVTRIAKDALRRAMDEDEAKSDTAVNSSTEPPATTDPSLELHQPLIVRIESSADGLDVAVNAANGQLPAGHEKV